LIVPGVEGAFYGVCGDVYVYVEQLSVVELVIPAGMFSDSLVAPVDNDQYADD